MNLQLSHEKELKRTDEREKSEKVPESVKVVWFSGISNLWLEELFCWTGEWHMSYEKNVKATN